MPKEHAYMLVRPPLVRRKHEVGLSRPASTHSSHNGIKKIVADPKNTLVIHPRSVMDDGGVCGTMLPYFEPFLPTKADDFSDGDSEKHRWFITNKATAFATALQVL